MEVKSVSWIVELSTVIQQTDSKSANSYYGVVKGSGVEKVLLVGLLEWLVGLLRSSILVWISAKLDCSHPTNTSSQPEYLSFTGSYLPFHLILRSNIS